MYDKNLALESNTDSILITDPYNIFYVSGFSGGEGYVYISENNKIIITDSRYTEAAEKEKKDGFTVLETSLSNPFKKILLKLLTDDKVHTLGFEDLNVTYSLYSHLKDICKKIELVPLEDKIDNLRRIKNSEEIALLSKAEEIGDIAFEHILQYIKPGVSELDIAAELEYVMKKNGASRLSFDTIVASGKHSSMPHAVPDERKVKNGDFITMDFGCVYKGYCSDMTRTVVVGKANEKQKLVYDTVLRAQTEALKKIRAGVKGSEIHAVAEKVIAEAGFGGYFGHGLGHSVGLYIHENPRFSPSEKGLIPAGTIETVEPGIYIPGEFGVRIEDMIVVTEEGYVNLTHSPKNLIELF